MGTNMARRLHKCGHPVVSVYDNHAPSSAAFAQELGIDRAPTLAAITAAADVIITVVTDDAPNSPCSPKPATPFSPARLAKSSSTEPP